MAVTITIHPTVDATSYVSLVEFKAWADQRLKSYAGKSDDQLSVAINAGAEYMDTRFDFYGYRKEAAQTREHPREQLYDSRGDKVDGVHQAVKDAQCAYAFMALSQELMAAPTRDESGRIVKSKDEAVGPIKTSVEYETIAGYEMPIFPAIDRLLYRHGLVRRKGGIGVGDVVRG